MKNRKKPKCSDRPGMGSRVNLDPAHPGSGSCQKRAGSDSYYYIRKYILRNAITRDIYRYITSFFDNYIAQRVHIHCKIQFWHICFTPPSLSISLSFSVSLLLSPTNFPIYLSLSYPPHRLNSLKWKERKGGKEGEREMKRVCEREIDGGVSG